MSETMKPNIHPPKSWRTSNQLQCPLVARSEASFKSPRLNTIAGYLTVSCLPSLKWSPKESVAEPQKWACWSHWASEVVEISKNKIKVFIFLQRYELVSYSQPYFCHVVLDDLVEFEKVNIRTSSGNHSYIPRTICVGASIITSSTSKQIGRLYRGRCGWFCT